MFVYAHKYYHVLHLKRSLNFFFKSNFSYLEKVALKILDKTKLDEKTKRLLSREINSMEKLNHPNIIRIFEVLETASKIYIALEYACHGELFHKILSEGKFSEADAKIYFGQLTSAVAYMVHFFL